MPSLPVVQVPRSLERAYSGGSTRTKAGKVNPPQDPGLSPELAGVPVAEAALRGTGRVLRGRLRAWECLGLGGGVS